MGKRKGEKGEIHNCCQHMQGDSSPLNMIPMNIIGAVEKRGCRGDGAMGERISSFIRGRKASSGLRQKEWQGTSREGK